MEKTRLNISIDRDVHVYWRYKDINISQIVNDYLKGLMLVEEEDNEIAELELQEKELKEQMKKIQEQLSFVIMKISKEKSQREETKKEEMKMIRKESEAMRANNPLRYL